MPKRKQSGHVFIDIAVALCVLVLGFFYALRGLTDGSGSLLLAGGLGVVTVLVLAANIVMQNIEVKAWQERLSRFPSGIFSTVGIVLSGLAVMAGYYTDLRALLWISPVFGIVTGFLVTLPLSNENPRIEAADEWLGNGVDALLLLLFPAYIIGPVVVSVFAALFEDGVGQGLKNLVALLTFLALLTGMIAVLHVLACRFPGWACIMRWIIRIFRFGLFVLVPFSGLTVLFYTALQGPEGWLETVICGEMLLLSAGFAGWSMRKARRERRTSQVE